jgi:hypothetical protein
MMQSFFVLAALLSAAALPVSAQSTVPDSDDGLITVEFTNPNLSPSHWILAVRRDGSGHFRSERGDAVIARNSQIDAIDEDRDIQLSKAFTQQVFSAAQQHNWFNEKCDSKAKVAFQGWKKLSYKGPDGQGSCTFNYSQDRQIQSLGESLIGVAETLHEGARLELLLQHDRLGLDKEMEFISDSARDGRLREIHVIRDILKRLADDDELLERVRKRARALLAQADS